ncbi:DUF5302 domain-containing protein [Streptomyces sp. NPDC019990]|uniref:DUF5302 domain-containing protein n=1 Tax=Streptomyces sp. NPDC019990 TaxID=3154693 RepID=UPI0033E30B40
MTTTTAFRKKKGHMTQNPQGDFDQQAAREKFRAALNRKAQASQARQAHEQGRLKVKGMSGPNGRKRPFRRKTG